MSTIGSSTAETSVVRIDCMFIFPDKADQTLPYSGPNSFLSAVSAGQVKQVTQRGQSLEIEMTTTDPSTGKLAIQNSLVPSELATNVQTDINSAGTAVTTITNPKI